MDSIQTYLQRAVEEKASDLFLVAGKEVSMKKEGAIVPVREGRVMPEEAEAMVRELYELAHRPIDRYLNPGAKDYPCP